MYVEIECNPFLHVYTQVRVYQLEDDPRHFIGCNHPRYPSHKFIAAHKWRYMRDTENIPIQPIQKVGLCSWLLASDV